MIKVCILTSVHSPFDDRIFHKEAKSLEQAGYDVVLIAPHNEEETIDGIKIVPLPQNKNRFERMIKLLWKSFRLALKQQANIYHFHDPELIPVGLLLKICTNAKVIYDVHEDYPKQILTKDWLGGYVIRKIVSLSFDLLEQFSVNFFDHIISATPSIGEKFSESKTIILKNLPILSLIDRNRPNNTRKGKPVIIYSGGLSKIRGTKEIIQAMEFVKDRAELWLLGNWESNVFEKECEGLEGWKYTKYLGFVPLKDVYSFMKVADIGISILYPIKNYVTSLPIKSFEYMACSLPMVMSNFPYWENMFGECTIFVDPYGPQDIAEKILYLLDNPDKAKELGKKGKELIREKYSWEKESQKLISLYETC